MIKPTPARFAATPDYADLHRHLGGAVHPKILYGYLHDHTADVGVTPQERDWIHRLLLRFPEYENLRAYFSARRATLAEYLELHKLVEPLQTPGAMAYFLYRIARGARVFEHASLFLHIRYGHTCFLVISEGCIEGVAYSLTTNCISRVLPTTFEACMISSRTTPPS